MCIEHYDHSISDKAKKKKRARPDIWAEGLIKWVGYYTFI